MLRLLNIYATCKFKISLAKTIRSGEINNEYNKGQGKLVQSAIGICTNQSFFMDE